jgi:hypothetical protein
MLTELMIAFGIVAICVVLHTTGMVVLAERLLVRRARLEREQRTAHYTLLLLIMVFAIIITLHLAGTAIWAAFYQWQGLFPDYETALYFSLNSYTTVGYGDALLPRRWRLLGCIEGLTGVLLSGLSTAFLFAIVSLIFQTRVKHQSKDYKSRVVDQFEL